MDCNFDELIVSQKIFNTMNDVDSHIYLNYGFYANFSCTTEHNYGLLAIENVNQNTLKNNYNSLGNLRHDLNNDHVIDNNDNVGIYGGICQPTAASMAIRYMTLRGDITYTPQLNNDPLDIDNVFYEISYDYISVGWQGNGAIRTMCASALNSFFDTVNSNYVASYQTTDLLSLLSNAYEDSIPLIGHFSGDDGSHAVTISGYYAKHITYTDDTLPLEDYELPDYDFYEYYVAINTGWVDTIYDWQNYYGSTIPQWLYDNNYSYINLNDLEGVTYICEE